MDKNVYLDPALLKGAELRTVYILKNSKYEIVLQSDKPETNNIDEYSVQTRAEVLEKFPEVRKLFESEYDKSVQFRKGINSGKWYDFIIG